MGPADKNPNEKQTNQQQQKKLPGSNISLPMKEAVDIDVNSGFVIG